MDRAKEPDVEPTQLMKKMVAHLKELEKQRAHIQTEIREYRDLETTLQSWGEQKEGLQGTTQEGEKRMLHNVGCDGIEFYVQADIPPESMVCVDVGFEFRVEMTPTEALDFIPTRVDYLDKRLKMISDSAEQVRDHIRTITHAMMELERSD